MESLARHSTPRYLHPSPSDKPPRQLPLDVGEWLALTRRMPLAERGLLIDALFVTWKLGAVPEPERLSQLIACSRSEFLAAWPSVEAVFTRFHRQVEAERIRARARAARFRDGARQTNGKRWGM